MANKPTEVKLDELRFDINYFDESLKMYVKSIDIKFQRLTQKIYILKTPC